MLEAGTAAVAACSSTHRPSAACARAVALVLIALLSAAPAAFAGPGVTLRERTVHPAAQDAHWLVGDAPVLVIVQARARVSGDLRRDLAATGAEVVGYLPENAYLVHAAGPARGRLAALVGADPRFAGAAPLRARDKLDPALEGGGPRTVSVQRVRGEREVRRAGAAERAALAADPGVVAVDALPEPRRQDERQGVIVATGAFGSPGYLPALAALLPNPEQPFGFAIDFSDDAIDTGTDPPAHPDLHQQGSSTNPDRIAYIHKFTAPDDSGKGCGGHGTLNASIAAGASAGGDLDADGHRMRQGIAPGALIGGTTVFRCDGGFDTNGAPVSDLAQAAHIGGARIANASWGAPSGGEYDSLAQEIDRLVRDARPDLPGNQELPYVVAAGNASASITALLSPGTAKNVITVGASESVRPFPTSPGNPTGSDGCGTPNGDADDALQVPSWSLGGPTADGRLKPELVAPGTHVMGARSQLTPPDWIGDAVCGDEGFDETDPLTIASSGTSHAAPVVAGLAAIAREALVRGGAAPPSPALLKAMLVGAAQPLPGSWPGGRQGFGLARLRGADPRGRWLRDQQDLLTETGQSVSWTITPADPGAPLAVTLAWTDAPGLTVGAPWVNDLDLEVEAGGRLYRGNGFQNGVSVPDAPADRRDNVETVLLPAGSGPVTVRVRAANLPGNGVPGNPDATDQDFALATTGTAIGTIEPVRQAQPPAPAPAAPAPPAPAPAPKPAARRPALRVVGLPSTQRCLSRRVIRLRLRPAPGVQLLSARITLRGHRAVRLPATRATTSVSLRGLPRGRFTLRISVRTADGRTITLRRTYRTCTPKRR
jgi:hypothetical protein